LVHVRLQHLEQQQQHLALLLLAAQLVRVVV
jgi:hypothetical protein